MAKRKIKKAAKEGPGHSSMPALMPKAGKKRAGRVAKMEKADKRV